MQTISRTTEHQILDRVRVGRGVKIWAFVNAYRCRIGDDSQIGSFVELQAGVSIGERCKVQSHSFLCEGVTLEDEVFIGHGVMFINDRRPRATAAHAAGWDLLPVLVRRGASIGSNATIMGGVTIGERALVGAGAVVLHDVPDDAVVVGVPARVAADVRSPRAERASAGSPGAADRAASGSSG